MAKSEKQKQKLIRILELLYTRTDFEHGLAVKEIIDYLEEYGINAERKSIYDDFLTLSELGFEIDSLRTRPPRYYLANRIFELAELKLLVDAVQSSKFITERKSRELISKLELFAGSHGAGELSRQVYVEGRAKTMNKATLYIIDMLHSAINSNKSVTFKYFDYNSKKEKILRHGGELYDVSPAALIWSDENYYLVAFDNGTGIRKHYRVDKIQELSVTDRARLSEALKAFNSADYTQKVFGMYGGREELVTLDCDESLAGVIIDRFGSEHTFIKTDKGFSVSLRVMLSPNFYAWIAGFGNRICIKAPSYVSEEYVRILTQTLELYKK